MPPEHISAGATTRFAGRARVVINLAGGLNLGSEINLHAPALLPEDYCADIHERLVLYKRLANCETPEELEGMHEELVDRFDLLPDPAKVLLETHRLRIAAKPLGISRIDAGPESVLLQFIPNLPIDPARIIKRVQIRKTYKLGSLISASEYSCSSVIVCSPVNVGHDSTSECAFSETKHSAAY